jgi:hypothetical protein
MERASSDNQRVIICTGMLGSASTWLFNVIRLIEKKCNRSVAGEYADELTREFLLRLARAPGTFIIKSHHPRQSLLSAIHFGRLPVLLTIRDPRDAVASLMKRFGRNFDGAVTHVESSAATLMFIESVSNPMILRYEQEFFADWRTVSRVSAFIGSALSPEDAQSISRALSREQTLQLIDQKINDGTLNVGNPGTSCDPETKWHPHHIGDGRVGKFKDVLIPEQISHVTDRTRSYIERFYPAGTAPAA